MPKTRTKKEPKAIFTFEISTLNSLLKYAMCSFVPKSGIANLHRLMEELDINAYAYNPDIVSRLKLITYITESKLTYGVKDIDVLKTYIEESYPDGKDLLNELPLEVDALSASDTASLGKVITERLQYLYIFKYKDNIINLLNEFGKGGWTSYYRTIETVKTELQSLLMNITQVENKGGLIRRLNMSDSSYGEIVDQIMKKAKMPAAILQTGVRQLNAILSPGFKGGRLYLFLGLTGRFKSGTLLNVADQIRKYNPQIKPVEDGMRKTILFISNENSIEETYERLLDMYSDIDDDILQMSTEDAIKIIKEKGGYSFTENTGITIEFRYYANMEMSTGDLYTIVDEMADEGYKVIAVVLDYIARIRSVNGFTEERFRLQDVAKELKSFATFYSIPVITAQQVNREGNGIIDAAMRDDKADLAKFIGTTAVSESYGLIFEADWVALINLEKRKSDEQWFLTFNRLKIRGKQDPSAITYFNHPFADAKRIRLATDVELERTISVVSLASDLESIDTREDRLDTTENKYVTSGSIVAANHASSILQTLDLSNVVTGKYKKSA